MHGLAKPADKSPKPRFGGAFLCGSVRVIANYGARFSVVLKCSQALAAGLRGYAV